MHSQTLSDEKKSEQASLLAQLQIDRSDTQPSGSPARKRFLFAGGGAAVIAIIAIGVWASRSESDAVAATTQVAHPVVSAAQAPAHSNSHAVLLDASGYVVARRQATVSSKITGKIVEVTIEEGQRVKREQIIARLDNSTSNAALDQAKAQVEQARASLRAQQIALEDAESGYRRVERQVQLGAISLQAFDNEKATYNSKKSAVLIGERTVDTALANMEMARRNLEDTIVRAPFAGLVTEKSAQPGEVVSPVAGGGFTRTGIGTIVDMDSLEVEVDVSENFIDRVSKDQPITIRLNAYPEWEIDGHVIATIPAADRAKATVKVRIAIDSRDGRIIPNMGARVSFKHTTSDQVAALQSLP